MGMLAVLLIPLFMYQADVTIVNVAAPSIHEHLGASGAELELVVSGYLLASATLFITGARLGQMRGYRRIFLLGLAIFGLASLACGLAPSPAALIVARLAQGVGGALLIPQILTGIQLAFDGAARARALGLYAAALAAGAVTGQILGGLLVSADVLGIQWRPIFLINVPIAAAVLIAAARALPPDPPRGHGRLDLAGMATLSAALLLVVLPLTLGREAHWPAWTWICLAASVPLALAFLAIERRVAAPLVDPRLLRRPAIAWGLVPLAIAATTYYALLLTLALYLQQGLGRSPVESGLVLVPWVAAFGLPGRLLGRVPARLRPLVAPAGGVLLTVAYLGIAASLLAGWHPELLLAALLGLGGFGLGTKFSAIVEHLTAAATPRHAADISGVFTTSLQVAGTVGIAGFGTAYLGLLGSTSVSHAFGLIVLAYALATLGAAAAAYRATRPPLAT